MYTYTGVYIGIIICLKIPVNQDKTQAAHFYGSTVLVTRKLKLLSSGPIVHRFMKCT